MAINTATAVNFTALVNQTVDATLWTGVGAVRATSAAAGTVTTVNNGALASVYGVTGTNAGGLTVSVRATDLTSLTNTMNLSAAGAGAVIASVGSPDVVQTQTITMSSNGVEAVALATSGTNVLTLVDNPAAGIATDYAKLTVTGAGNNAITVADLTQNLTYDMSTATGNNTLRFNGALQSNTTVIGGTGTADTIRVTQGTVVAGITATGVEILRSANANASGTIAFNTGSSLTTLRIDGDTDETGILTLINPGTIATIDYRGDGLNTTVGQTQQFIGTAITGAYSGAADTVTMNFTNKGVTQLTGFTARGGFVANGVEAFVINSSANTGATAVTTVEGLSSNTLQTITAVSTGGVALGVINATPNAGNSTLTSVNLTGVTGSVASSLSFDGTESVGAATQVTGPAGTGTFTVTTGTQQAGDTLLITGGNSSTTTIDAQNTTALDRAAFAGVLVYSSSAVGVINALNVGDLSDAVAAITNSTTIATFTGTASRNTITGGVGEDTITVTASGLASTNTVLSGALNDTVNASGSTIAVRMNGQAGADRLTGGSGNDTFALTDIAETKGADFVGANTTTADIDKVVNFVGSGAAAGDSILLGTGAGAFGTAVDFTVNSTAVVVATAVATAADMTALVVAAQAATPGAASTSAVARVYDVTVAAGALAGRYLIVNDATAGIAVTDTIVSLVGITGALNAQDFTFGSATFVA